MIFKNWCYYRAWPHCYLFYNSWFLILPSINDWEQIFEIIEDSIFYLLDKKANFCMKKPIEIKCLIKLTTIFLEIFLVFIFCFLCSFWCGWWLQVATETFCASWTDTGMSKICWKLEGVSYNLWKNALSCNGVNTPFNCSLTYRKSIRQSGISPCCAFIKSYAKKVWNFVVNYWKKICETNKYLQFISCW